MADKGEGGCAAAMLDKAAEIADTLDERIEALAMDAVGMMAEWLRELGEEPMRVCDCEECKGEKNPNPHWQAAMKLLHSVLNDAVFECCAMAEGMDMIEDSKENKDGGDNADTPQVH